MRREDKMSVEQRRGWFLFVDGVGRAPSFTAHTQCWTIWGLCERDMHVHVKSQGRSYGRKLLCVWVCLYFFLKRKRKKERKTDSLCVLFLSCILRSEVCNLVWECAEICTSAYSTHTHTQIHTHTHFTHTTYTLHTLRHILESSFAALHLTQCNIG